ncbi:SEC-C domain-containing protein [Providencia stuartii]|uniref:YecA family protein n=1 Tax=Providencia stuartii TaxID=588 RepID=UPI000EF8678E|nr:SEC-C domain-containing protein [Providencia stuartii]
MKLGRNDKCWCGSGVKYKKCHLNREKMPEISRGDIYKHSKKIGNVKYCSVPDLLKCDCSKKMIRAHTISKSSSLKSIAEDSHVMGIKQTYDSVEKNSGILKLELIGINSASTFTGFCSVHDRDLFSPIENDIFIPSKKNCFLLSYRPLCRELYAKKNNGETADFLKQFDKGTDIDTQKFIQRMMSSFENGIDNSLNDLGILKGKMDDILSTESFDDMNHYVIELSEIPQVNASGSILPDFDFDGNQLQTLAESVVSTVIFNCIYSGKNGYFIFSWLKDDDVIVRKFIESLNSKSDMADRLVAFLYSYCENTFCSPSWWNDLSTEKQSDINKRIMEGILPFDPRDGSSLTNILSDYGALIVNQSYYL